MCCYHCRLESISITLRLSGHPKPKALKPKLHNDHKEMHCRTRGPSPNIFQTCLSLSLSLSLSLCMRAGVGDVGFVEGAQTDDAFDKGQLSNVRI